ncbi:hypothetical protein C8R43DRAFT_1189309 [Mycena crocata]|nr:hypothetical protein C8R43DRAFT_1189309 [Mycena crocata]
MRTFPCSQESSVQGRWKKAPLPYFIAYVVHYGELDEITVYASLVLLQRLEDRLPEFHRSSGRRLFLCAYMLASKLLWDGAYTTRSWRLLGQRLYTVEEINRTERLMCIRLEWVLSFNRADIETCTASVTQAFWRHVMNSQPSLSYSVGLGYT